MDKGQFIRKLHIMGYKKCGENSWRCNPNWLISIAPITTITIIDYCKIKVEELYADDVNNPTIKEFNDYQEVIDYLL
jgi:hypothetical protein